jgi:hypothetical protein
VGRRAHLRLAAQLPPAPPPLGAPCRYPLRLPDPRVRPVCWRRLAAGPRKQRVAAAVHGWEQ